MSGRGLAIPAGLPRHLEIGAVRVEPPFVMAPMADVTNVHFHEALREIGGPGLYVAEMVSADALARGLEPARRMLARPRGCPAFAVQVYGHCPERVAAAGAQAVAEGADVVDVNLGCPAKTLTGRACGSALLREPLLVARILGATRAALPTTVPLTVKIRTGWDDGCRNFLEIGRIAQEEGAAAVTLHGRSRAQMFRGEADWDAVAALKRGLAVPVIGNGDVRTAEDALDRMARSGCDGVMIARGALANPWIFRQLRQALAGQPVTEPDLDERRRVILDHHERLLAALPPDAALHGIRKFLGFYTHGLPRGVELRRQLEALRDAATFRDGVGAFFDRLAASARAA